MQAAEINRTILVNGESSADVSVIDRGLQYGHGLFETIAIKNGQPEHWERHLARLNKGCLQLLISPPDPSLLKNEINQLIDQSSLEDQAVLKIIITCGEGGRGYKTPEVQKTNRILSLTDWPYPKGEQDPIVVRVCEMRLGSNLKLGGIKHLNRLEQVLARSEWSGSEITEGLMLNEAGNVIEGTMSNLFFVKDNTLNTPQITSSGIQGVMREVILDLAKQLGIRICIGDFTLADILQAEELFLSNSLIKIWPVKKLIAEETVMYGFPGSMTNKLSDQLIS